MSKPVDDDDGSSDEPISKRIRLNDGSSDEPIPKRIRLNDGESAFATVSAPVVTTPAAAASESPLTSSSSSSISSSIVAPAPVTSSTPTEMINLLMSDTICPICRDECFDLLIFPCQHRICRRCLTGMIGKQYMCVHKSIRKFEQIEDLANLSPCVGIETSIMCAECKDSRVTWTNGSTNVFSSFPSSTLSLLAMLLECHEPKRLEEMLETSNVVRVNRTLQFRCCHSSCQFTAKTSEGMARHWQECRKYDLSCPFPPPANTDPSESECPAGKLQLNGDSDKDTTIKQYLMALRTHLRTGQCHHPVFIFCGYCSDRVLVSEFGEHVDTHRILFEATLADTTPIHIRQFMLRKLRSVKSDQLCECGFECTDGGAAMAQVESENAMDGEILCKHIPVPKSAAESESPDDDDDSDDSDDDSSDDYDDSDDDSDDDDDDESDTSDDDDDDE